MLLQIYVSLVILLVFPEQCHFGLSPILTLSQVRTIENDSLSLTCTGNGLAGSYAVWTVNNNRVLILQIFNCSSFLSFNISLYEYQCVNASTFVLKVKIVTNNYHGSNWQCGIRNAAGLFIYSNPVVVFVVVPVFSVIMTTSQKTAITVIQNTTIEFVCNTSAGRPQPMIRWFKDSGTSSNTNDDTEIASGIMNPFPLSDDQYVSTTGTLKYQTSKDDNWNIIYCTANNTASHVIFSNKPVLNILYPPIVNNVLNKSVVEGVAASVDCLITPGNPAQANFTWTKKNNSWNQTNQRMHIPHVTLKDAGLYECTALNYMQPTVGPLQIGKSSNSFYLEVLPENSTGLSAGTAYSSSPVGTIVGVIVGVTVGVTLIIVVVCLVCRLYHRPALTKDQEVQLASSNKKSNYGFNFQQQNKPFHVNTQLSKPSEEAIGKAEIPIDKKHEPEQVAAKKNAIHDELQYIEVEFPESCAIKPKKPDLSSPDVKMVYDAVDFTKKIEPTVEESVEYI